MAGMKAAKEEKPKAKQAMKQPVNAAKAAEKKAEAKKAEKKPVKTEKAAESKAEKPIKAAKPKAAEKKAEGKKAEKPKTDGEKVEAKKAEKKPKVKKEIVKGRKDKFTKSKQAKKLAILVKAKKRRMFRGRFGKRSVRKVSNKKWQKWRKPRGIDIYFKKEDGLVPGTGYRTSKKIRFVHPSGYRESLVRNLKELEALAGKREEFAARISGKIGKRKKTEMLKKADELKILVLNR